MRRCAKIYFQNIYETFKSSSGNLRNLSIWILFSKMNKNGLEAQVHFSITLQLLSSSFDSKKQIKKKIFSLRNCWRHLKVCLAKIAIFILHWPCASTQFVLLGNSLMGRSCEACSFIKIPDLFMQNCIADLTHRFILYHTLDIHTNHDSNFPLLN